VAICHGSSAGDSGRSVPVFTVSRAEFPNDQILEQTVPGSNEEGIKFNTRRHDWR